MLGIRSCGRRKIPRRNRKAKKISLRLIALSAEQKAQLLIGLNAFRDHLDVQPVRHRNDRSHHRRGIDVRLGLSYKTLIDLQPVYLVLQQIREAAKSCAKIVDRDLHSELPYLLQLVEIVMRVDHQHALGNLNFQMSCSKATLRETVFDHLQQVLLLKLPWRQIYRYRQFHSQLILQRLALAARNHKGPFADRNNQPRLFRQRNELGRAILPIRGCVHRSSASMPVMAPVVSDTWG